MATLNEMVSKAHDAKKIGNRTICDTARAAGCDINDEASSLAYLDALTAKTLKVIGAWDGRPISSAEQKANPYHPVVEAVSTLKWLTAIGATKHAEMIKSAAASAMSKAA